MKWVLRLAATVCPVLAGAQDAVQLPEFGVNSPRISNQVPVGTFAMPVSALRYDPRVDLHGRNLAEAQADVTVRGGTFENTGFQVGAVTLGDPQTGHYFAEIPVAPAMLTAPVLATGTELALGAANATAGAISQGWRSIRSGGSIAAAVGSFDLVRGEVHLGAEMAWKNTKGRRIGADVAVAHSASDGSLPYGESRFDRVNGRIQTRDANSQTDLFAGYQAKFFGWPNLYTPFNSNETENLQTVLLALNHRVTHGAGEFLEAGVFHRRHRDDYAFNRFAPVGPVHPFQHTTWLSGAALSARHSLGTWQVNLRAEAAADRLRSTSLTFGRYNSRTSGRVVVLPEREWRETDGVTRLRFGAAYDATNCNGAAISPQAEWAREFAGRGLRQVRLGFAQASQVPTYTALNSNPAAGLFRGNAGLGRQTSRTVEAAAVAAAGGWLAEAAIFGRRDEALVDWTFRRGVTARTANAVDLDVAGVEIVARREWSRVDAVLGYTALTKTPDYRGAGADASFYALNYARHRLTAAVTLRLTREVTLRMDNVLQRQAANLLRNVGGRDAFLTSSAVAYRPSAWPGLEFSLQAENLWNEAFQSVPAVPAAKRQVAFGVTRVW
ncbi:MAG: hypothetical protein B9S34_02135 [Opitutia bacterium Tous-C1TDCM]|nr:MAG: hypothetical protein B9S34_02135 [Opitutae bacterium Tous-C1TDCM]